MVAYTYLTHVVEYKMEMKRMEQFDGVLSPNNVGVVRTDVRSMASRRLSIQIRMISMAAGFQGEQGANKGTHRKWYPCCSRTSTSSVCWMVLMLRRQRCMRHFR